MYNCIVDSSQYYEYRTKLRSANAAGKVAAVNSSWKCALVSQGIVCGNGGSFYGENCIYKGIETILKNNDKGGTNEGEILRPVAGGFKLVNCSLQTSANSTPVTTFSDASNLTAANFKWHTPDGQAPFNVSAVALEDLAEYLSNEKYGAGVNSMLQERLLKSKYSV